MSPRHFVRAIYGPYYLSRRHFINDLPSKPKTKFEKASFYVLKYTGISKLVAFIQSPDKISRKTESLPYQATSGDEIDLKALREQRRGSKQSDQ